MKLRNYLLAVSKTTIQKVNDWSKEMFSSCKMDLHKMSRSERNLSLDTVVDSIVCCIELIATTTVDDVGMLFRSSCFQCKFVQSYLVLIMVLKLLYGVLHQTWHHWGGAGG